MSRDDPTRRDVLATYLVVPENGQNLDGMTDPEIHTQLLAQLDDADLDHGVVRLDTRDMYTAAFIINCDEVLALPADAPVSSIVAAVLAFIRRVGSEA